MSTKYAISALFALSFLAVSPTLAHEVDKVVTAAQVREAKEQVRGRLLNPKASSTVKRIELQQSVIKRLAEHTSKVLTATADRLEKIMTRLESRIAKVKAEGKDVTASEKSLAEAKTHLAEARAKITEFSSITLTAEKMQENMTKLRLVAGDVKEHLGETRRALMAAVSVLKPGRTATTTPVTN